MQIKIVAYGIARDIIGGNELDLEIKTNQTVLDTLDQIKSIFPDFQKLTSLVLAVNENYVSDNQVINEGDELVLIPPVSGG